MIGETVSLNIKSDQFPGDSMGSLTGTKKGTVDKRIRAVSDCGTRVLDLLRGRFPVPDALRLEVESYIQHLPSVAVSAEKAGPLDVLGTDLWNASTGLVHQDDHQQPQDSKGQPSDCARLGIIIRVFAFMLLDIAHISISRPVSNEEGKVRIVKTAFKASRLCLEATALDYALKILERCAEYVILPGTDTGTSLLQEPAGKVQAAHDALQTEYCLLRIMCAWKSDRLDTAHHFYLRLCSTGFDKHERLVLDAADLFWCIARTSSNSAGEVMPLLWLERGLAALSACDADTVDDDAAELRLGLTSDLVKQLLCSGDTANIERASQLVDELESEFFWHNRVTVQVLKFQILASTSPINADQVDQTLIRIMKMIVLTESNFKMVMQMTSKVSKFSLPTSLAATSFFIRARLIPDISSSDQENHMSRSWLEKAIVAFVHLLAFQTDSITPTTVTDLQQLFDSISQCVENPLTPPAIYACQALIWKLMRSTNGRDSMQWCDMLQHSLFAGSSAENKARIIRRKISIALDTDDTTSARQAFDQMSKEAQNEPFTRCLAFKLALRCQDHVLARDSLDIIARNVDTDATYLFACVVEAQQSASREVARLALQALLVRRPAGIALPPLLRAVAHLLISELDDTSREVQDIVSEITDVLETTVNDVFKADVVTREIKGRLPKEIEWWTKNTYNLIIRLFTRVETHTIVKLLHISSQFFDLSAENAAIPPNDLRNHRMICDFLTATALVATGRLSDTSREDMLQAYREVREHVKSYMNARSDTEDTKQDGLEVKRTLEMLKYDLESILRLEQWNGVDTALRSCLHLQNIERWGTLADLLVILHGHMDRFPQDSDTGRLLTEVLQRIVNETWRHDKDIAKVARWVRWTFSICLADRRSNLSFKLLGQAAGMAANGRDGRHDRYPEAELHWLASSSFNRAIDLISHGDDEAAEPWMEGALELARWAQDGGSLLQLLTKKRDIARERSIKGDKGGRVESTC